MYGFETRIPYATLKNLALDAYFDFARTRGLMRNCPHSEIIAALVDEYESGFEHPIENLMWWVILLVLTAGLHPEMEKQFRDLITKIFAKNSLETLLKDVPVEEVDLFKHDLIVLKII